MLKVADEVDQVLVAKLYKAEQEHVFRFWSRLSPEEQRALLDQLAGVDLQQLAKLVQLIDAQPVPHHAVSPVTPLVLPPERRAELGAIGWKALEEGKVACLMVAGGQGTRLGWPKPKGSYPVGPCSGKTLYQLFGEQLIALGRRAGRPLPWYVLTSRLNNEETRAIFAENKHFGVDPAQVSFLVQRDLPNTDFRGKLLMATPSSLATSPNGHGGTLLALEDGGVLAAMQERGNEYLFYWQVDNPLCRVADPVFLGAHIEAGAQASTKVVKKTEPSEKIGLLVERDGRTSVIEYSEMSEEQKAARDAELPDELQFRAGNIAVHLFDRAFLSELQDGDFELEYHVARKKVPCVDEAGESHKPTEPNAIKFETFIFGALAEAETHLTFEVAREEEFEPLKNAEGPYSPATVKTAQSERHARWLEACGFEVERDEAGQAKLRYEISPLTALDPEELQGKLRVLPSPKDGGISF